MRPPEIMRVYALLMPKWPNRECAANALRNDTDAVKSAYHVSRNFDVANTFSTTASNVARMADSLRNEGPAYSRCGTF